MIARIWHGWTTPQNADPYQRLLEEEIFPTIAAMEVAGCRGVELLRRPLDDEVEFVTIMRFETWQAVRDFAGEDYEQAYVPDAARRLLKRFDQRSQHYEIRRRVDLP
ncbi:MAG: antibiotic biosynthesis monooxygenase [Acidobacteria bacterium]|nr:MAG: antibiotic biosynthesis monooxygenase [Acidobacteriota bacterium]